MATTIKSFSSDIQGHVETYDESLNSSAPTDIFQINPITRRKLYSQWMLLATGDGLEPGYKRVKDTLETESKEVDNAAQALFAGKDIVEKQKQILVVGWPKLFKKIFPKILISKNSENLKNKNFQSEDFQDPETTKKAKEFHWVEWEKAIPRDERGKIDPRILDKEKRAFEEYWRNLLEVMKKMWIPGKSWGIKLGEYYHRDVGWY